MELWRERIGLQQERREKQSMISENRMIKQSGKSEFTVLLHLTINHNWPSGDLLTHTGSETKGVGENAAPIHFTGEFDTTSRLL
jgi:hypothetical protein